MTYTRRIIDDGLDEYFGDLPAISIEGAKGTGKTSTASQRVESVLALDDESVRSVVASDVTAAVRRHASVLVDEWQRVPPIWDAVRRAVDEDSRGGRFLLTGSATVPAGTRIHSGAGRIVDLQMRPMTLPERGVTDPVVTLGALGRGGAQIASGTKSGFTVDDYAREIVASGFPGVRPYAPKARRRQLESYVNRIVEHEIPDAGGTLRRPTALKAWLGAYAAATSTTASYNVILDAATPNEGDKPARATAEAYREILTRLHILDPVPAWLPSFSHLKRLGASSKHHLVDPALAAILLDASEASLLGAQGPTLSRRADATLLGALFESLVTQSVRVFAQRHGWRVSHFRTRNGDHEVDLIVEVDGMRILAIEVKLTSAVSDSDVTHLRWLKDQLGDRVVDVIVVNTGPYAYRRTDGVGVVPLALLGP